MELSVALYDSGGQFLFKRLQLVCNGAIRAPNDLGRENSRIRRARFADGHGRDGNAGGHLHRGEQSVHPFEARGIDRHADHRQDRVRGNRAGQVRRGAAAADFNMQPPVGWRGGVLGCRFWRTMGGYDAGFVGDAEAVEPVFSLAHDFEIRVAAHQDTDFGLHVSHDCFLQIIELRVSRSESRV